MNWKASVIESLGEDVRVPHVTVRPVRMVQMSRKKRMVADEIADAPFLLAVVVPHRTFIQENSSIVSFMIWLRCANRRSRGEAMSRGGNFHQAGKAPWSRAFWYWSDQRGSRNPHPPTQQLGTDPGPHSGVRPSGISKAQYAKASPMVLMLILLLHRHAVPLTAPATSSSYWPSITARIVRMSFFAIRRWFVKTLLIFWDRTVNVFWPLRSRLRKEARERTPCKSPSLVSFHHFIRKCAPGIMELNRLDFDIRVERVFVEKHRFMRSSWFTCSIASYNVVSSICFSEALMSKVEFHVLCMGVGLDLGCHVVIGVVLGFTTQTQHQLQSSFLWNCEGCLVVRSGHGPQAEVAQGVGPGPLVELWGEHQERLEGERWDEVKDRTSEEKTTTKTQHTSAHAWMGWRVQGGLEPQVRCDTIVHQWTALSVLSTACCARSCARRCLCCSSHCAQAWCCCA